MPQQLWGMQAATAAKAAEEAAAAAPTAKAATVAVAATAPATNQYKNATVRYDHNH